MKKSRFTGEQINTAIQQVQAGLSAAEVCRKLGISEPTFYRWRDKYCGLAPPEAISLISA